MLVGRVVAIYLEWSKIIVGGVENHIGSGGVVEFNWWWRVKVGEVAVWSNSIGGGVDM
jgi:hypothetical protein